MDSLTANTPSDHYRHTVETVLSDYADFLGNDDQVQVEGSVLDLWIWDTMESAHLP
jgi:hypothetical protein